MDISQLLDDIVNGPDIPPCSTADLLSIIYTADRMLYAADGLHSDLQNTDDVAVISSAMERLSIAMQDYRDVRYAFETDGPR